MILVTGGSGFIGSHTTRALVDLGESCVVVARRVAEAPEEYNGKVLIEQADIADRTALLEIGRRHPITGIVHLAGSVPWPPGEHEAVPGARRAIDSLLNVFELAMEQRVPRVGVASTIGVYGGAPGRSPFREDATLPMISGHVIPAFKKIGELLTNHLAGSTGLQLYSFRIAAVWGPGGRASSPFFAAPQLVHAAAGGTAPDLSALRFPVYEDDGVDMVYVKDVGRAIALLQQAPTLRHETYNIGGGRLTTYGRLLAAIREVVPEFAFELPEGRNQEDALYLDTTRLQQDTGYHPAYDTHRATADYMASLRESF